MKQTPRGSRRSANERRGEEQDEREERPHRVRRSGTNPAAIAIAIVGVGLLAGLILIVAGKRQKLIERELPPQEATAPRPTEDALLLKLERLKASTIPPREGLRELAALLDEAKLPETKQAIRAVRDTKFISLAAEEDRKAFAAVRAEAVALAAAGKIQEGLRKIQAFRDDRDHAWILANDKNPVVKLLSQEILSAKAEVEGKIVERFAADLARLTAAVQAKNFEEASFVYDRILTYGTDAMNAEAKGVLEPLIASYRAADAAKEQRSSAQKQLEVGARPKGNDEPGGNEEEIDAGESSPPPPPPRGDDDFFGGGKDSGGAAKDGAPGAAMATIEPGKDGKLAITINGEKAALEVAGGAKLFRDTTVAAKKFVETLAPDTPVLILAKTRAIAGGDWRDPQGGRRITDPQFIIFGSGLPQPPAYRDPKDPAVLWHAATFVRLPPPTFRLNNQNHTLQGAPAYAVKREGITVNDLKGKLPVFVKGKGSGMGSGTGTFTADAIVILPSVAKTAAYQSLLKAL